MAAIQPLYLLLGIQLDSFSKQCLLLVEAELFARICEELREVIRNQNKEYYRVINFNFEMEKTMLDKNFIRNIINDIISTEEYDYLGIAVYTDTPADIITEIFSGDNINPSFLLARKIIDLHRMVRPELYQNIINKIKQEIMVAV